VTWLAGLRAGLATAARVVLAAGRAFVGSYGPHWAAAIAYYALLSLFPLLLAFASIAAFFVEPRWAVEQATQWLGDVLPPGSAQIEQIVRETVRRRGGASLLSLGVLLWAGSRVFGALSTGLNAAFDVEERYGIVRRAVVQLAMVGTIGLAFALALGLQSLWEVLRRWIDVSTFVELEGVSPLAHWTPRLLLGAAFLLLYRFAPRPAVHWPAALGGALAATALAGVAQPLFFHYLGTFANYSLIYGSLAMVITLVLWAWIMAMVVLFAGHLAAQIQVRLAAKGSGA